MAAAIAVELPLLLGGVLATTPETEHRWPVASGWQAPVGAPEVVGAPSATGSPAFQVNRSVEWRRGRPTHQGCDLANGRDGDTVRAVAAGLVTLALDGDNGNGYGGHVVIAHRLEDDHVVYTVYAHLMRGTVAVDAGDAVLEGDPIGRVGRTGRASTPHLHFEVREPSDLGERWERARVVEPLAFLEAHRAEGAPALAANATPGAGDAGEADDADTTGEGPATDAYVNWAAQQGMLAPGAASGPLTRATWWRMLARATGLRPARSREAAEVLRDTLIDAGVLPEEETGAQGEERMGWTELARDVHRMRQLGARALPGPLERAEHDACCERALGLRSPAAHAGTLRRRSGDPTLGHACLLLADVSGPRTAPRLEAASHAPRAAHGKKASHAKHRSKPRRTGHAAAKHGAAKRPAAAAHRPRPAKAR